MSSRSADRPPARGLRAASITVRLTVLYAAASLLLLAGLEMALYAALVSSLRARDASVLADEVSLVRAIIADPSRGTAGLEDEIVWEPRFERSRPLAVRVLDRDGRVVVQSPGTLARAFADAPFPRPTPPARPLAPVPWRTAGGRPLLLLAASAAAPHRTSGEHLQLVLDLSGDARLLAGYRARGLGVLVTGVLLSALLGAAVARSGLRPLQAMRAAAEGITAERLAERVSAGAWPRELVGLAGAFDAMLERLEEAFNRLSRFSADLAHELRTPLTVLTGEMELALTRERDAGEYRRVLESGLDEVTRLRRTVDALLFLARTESAEVPFEPAGLDAAAEAADILDLYEATAAARGVRLAFSGGGRLEASPGLFRAALANLVANALAYTPAGGRVTVTAADTGGALCVEVADTGPGIPPEQLPRIFDRFYRAAPGGARAVPGAGLGLAIVKAIMARHGGSVTVHSAPGAGSTFRLTFPRAAPAKMTAP